MKLSVITCLKWRGMGLVLFLFIPLVLYLFIIHPRPVLLSLGIGVFLMLSHRFPARAYMKRVASVKCLWCDRCFKPHDQRVALLVNGKQRLKIYVHPEHERPVRQFYGWLHRGRFFFQAGIFIPLFLLLVSLLVAGLNGTDVTNLTTQIFKGIIGWVVNIAAFGYIRMKPDEILKPPFPPHNFHLIGIRNILWIFRIVGIWWLTQVLLLI